MSTDEFAQKINEEFPPDIAQLIFDLKKEIEEGTVDERIIDFLKNLETVDSKESLEEDALDKVSGGMGSKKLASLAAAASLLLGGFGGVPKALPDRHKEAVHEHFEKLKKAFAEAQAKGDKLTEKDLDILLSKQVVAYSAIGAEVGEEVIDTARRTGKIVAAIAGTTGAVMAGAYIIKNAADIVRHFKNFYMSISNGIKNFYLKHTSKAIDIKLYETILGRIETRLKKELVGQDKAIKDMINTMRGYFESALEAQAMGKKFEGGLILYLTGLPATGKSTAMKIIGEEMGLKPYIGRMSDAIEDKGNNANTVAARLTKQIIVDDGQSKSKQDTPLMRQVKVGIPTLYCLDEIDKMRNLDRVLQRHDGKNSDGKWMGESVDEMLRNFGDTGQINGINASGSILIATSNETPEQLQQLESSLYNRYKSCHVHFKEFNTIDYKEIISRKTKQTLDYYKKVYHMDVELGRSMIDHYAQKFEKETGGGRSVDALAITIRATLKNYINANQKHLSKKVVLEYDQNKDALFVSPR